MIAPSSDGTQARPPIRPACTVVLLRDACPGIEVLLLRRVADAKFLGGFDVFPGGALVREDDDARALQRVRGLTPAQANARLNVSGGAMAFWLAAVRETFEECGILLACDAEGHALSPARVERLSQDRAALNAGTQSFVDWLHAHELTVMAEAFTYFDHWLTPPDRPRRFDTRFFIARAPQGQVASPDGSETVDARWLRPGEALALAQQGTVRIANATASTLQQLARASSVDEALDAARSLGVIDLKRPCVALGSAGKRMFIPGDAAYDEIHWCDPHESTQTTYDMTPGVVKRLDALVARLIAPNPGPMTGPGTNTYFVGERELAVIDPGPLDASHLAATLAHGAGRIRWILCTHAHRDHSPAAAQLAAATGAQVIGIPPPASPRHDETFVPDRVVHDGEALRLGGLDLTAIHTPGHAPNHVCFLLASTRMLFTGDHVMQGSTVVIPTPEGSMRDYLNSLEHLLAVEIAVIAPGHGYLIGAAHREIRKLIDHRRWREARVVTALKGRGEASVDDLLDDVYPDLRSVLRGPAAQSLRAHLVKLVEDRVAVASGDRFRIVGA